MTEKPINDGGPAFPELDGRAGANGPEYFTQSGMTLRDYFAGQALNALRTNNSEAHSGITASLAYMDADAMIQRRERETVHSTPTTPEPERAKVGQIVRHKDIDYIAGKVTGVGETGVEIESEIEFTTIDHGEYEIVDLSPAIPEVSQWVKVTGSELPVQVTRITDGRAYWKGGLIPPAFTIVSLPTATGDKITERDGVWESSTGFLRVLVVGGSVVNTIAKDGFWFPPSDVQPHSTYTLISTEPADLLKGWKGGE